MTKRKARAVRERFEAWAEMQDEQLSLVQYGPAGARKGFRYWCDTTALLFKAYKAGLRAGRGKK